MAKPKTCSLRKTCPVCKESFGRRLQALRPQAKTRILISIDTFEKQVCCSRTCSDILRARARRMKSVEKKTTSPTVTDAHALFNFRPQRQ